MNPEEARERAEQEAADQVEKRRVVREEEIWAEAVAEERDFGGIASRFAPGRNLIPPYLFADERSQRRVEEEARQERPLDDYAAWTEFVRRNR
jgi:hypothetical protein